MAIKIGEAISQGLENTVNKGTLILASLFTLVFIISDIGTDTLEAYQGTSEPALAIGSSLGVGTSLVVLSTIGSLILLIGTLRFYVTEDLQLEKTMFTENIFLPALNFIAASLLFALSITVGLVLLVIPGLFLLVALYYYMFRVSLEDENFIQSLKSSYNLTKGDRLELFGLGALVVIPSTIISVLLIPLVFLSMYGAFPIALISIVIYNIVTAFVSLAILSIASQAYLQLLEGE